MKKKAVLLIGFGGPTKIEDVRPFLQSIVGNTNIPTQRVEEVYRHYELVGGVSPFNAITEKQKNALEKNLKAKGFPMPVGVAFRHSQPSFQDAFENFKKFGIESVTGFVLASFRSFVSREWYYEKVEEGRRLAGADSIEVHYTESFDNDPLYLQAQRERIDEIWTGWSEKEKNSSCVIFTAHSIPTSMCEQSCAENGNRCYGFQFYEAAASIARQMNARQWAYCYQSQSGNPRDKWLDPDVKRAIRDLDPARIHRVLVVPVGFLCDNVEVIYDLDHEARDAAKAMGMEYFRCGTVSDHPLFISMMTDRVLDKERVQC